MLYLKITIISIYLLIYILKLLKLIFNLKKINNSIFDFPTRRGYLIFYCFCVIIVLAIGLKFYLEDLSPS